MDISFYIHVLLLTSILCSQIVATFDFFGMIHRKNKSLPITTTTGVGTGNPNTCNLTMVPIKHLCVCNSDRVEADCSHMNIQDLPSEISFPSGIKIISFRDNLIDTIKYEAFYSGPDVTELDLSNNRLDFISSQAFQAFKKLRRLILSHNRIWTLNKGVLEYLKDLRELDLSYNDIPNVPVLFFKPISELRVLNLESNPLVSLDPKQFDNLPKLLSLNLEATMLKGLPDHVFWFTTNLKRLSLASNLMEEIPTTALKVLNKVQNLDLSDNVFDTIPPNAFPGMKSLGVLYLDRMPVLTKIDKYAFSGLTRLHEVHCSYNFNLREFHEDAFVNNATGQLLSVEQLFIRQNKLSSLSFQLLPWSEYLEVHLRDNPWHCDCHMLWMLGIQTKNKFQDHVKCSSPAHMHGRTLNSVKPQDLICGFTALDILLITLGITVAFLIILLMVALCVWKRHFSSVSRTYFRVSKRSDSDDVVYEKTTCDSTDG